MTTTMSHQGLELPPSSRQDIVSALLNDYGSFEDHDTSLCSNYTPNRMSRDLPPVPPPKNPEREREYNNVKTAPYGGRLSMRFQLRVDEPTSPDSPDGSRSSIDSQPRRIKYWSISRDSKPPSLKLLASNGTTAKVPPTPAPILETLQPVTSSRTPLGSDGKSLPPPPPDKSARPSQKQRTPIGDEASANGPPRTNSRLPKENGSPDEAAAPVKRKPLPITKFTSLLDLKNRPRGGKGGPMPVPRSHNQSMDQTRKEANSDRPRTAVEAKTEDAPEQSEYALTKSRSNEDTVSQMVPPVPIMKRLPSTPTPDQNFAPAPPPKKPFAGVGLPSNPRAKHAKGKSSTAFEWTVSKTVPSPSPAPAPAPAPNTLTPNHTPSPGKPDQIQRIRGAAPLASVEKSQRRPFSFEPGSTAPRKQPEQVAGAPVPARPTVPSLTMGTLSGPASDTNFNIASFPPRSSSKLPAAFAGLPSQQPQLSSPTSLDSSISLEASAAPEIKPQTLDVTTPEIPIFTPLTIAPVPKAAAPITEKHLSCYTKHNHYIWSKNDFQPMACMVCKSNERDRKWACTWCYLRICLECSEELLKTEGRDIKPLLEKKGINVQGAVKRDERRERGRSMEITAMGERARSEGPKRHDSGAGTKIPSVTVWKAAEERHGGDGYGSEDDFS